MVLERNPKPCKFSTHEEVKKLALLNAPYRDLSRFRAAGHQTRLGPITLFGNTETKMRTTFITTGRLFAAIGLAIVRKAIERMGGRVGLERHSFLVGPAQGLIAALW